MFYGFICYWKSTAHNLSLICIWYLFLNNSIFYIINENRFKPHGYLSFVSCLRGWLVQSQGGQWIFVNLHSALLFWNKCHLLVFMDTWEVGYASEGSRQDCVITLLCVNGIEILILPNKRMLVGHICHRGKWTWFVNGGRFWGVWSVKSLNRIMSTLATLEGAERCKALKASGETFSWKWQNFTSVLNLD